MRPARIYHRYYTSGAGGGRTHAKNYIRYNSCADRSYVPSSSITYQSAAREIWNSDQSMAFPDSQDEFTDRQTENRRAGGETEKERERAGGEVEYVERETDRCISDSYAQGRFNDILLPLKLKSCKGKAQNLNKREWEKDK